MPPVFATMRAKCATNSPGARSPMLRPYCFCHALKEVVSILIVVPICAMRCARRPCRLLRCAASWRSVFACCRLVALYRLLSFQCRRPFFTRPFSSKLSGLLARLCRSILRCSRRFFLVSGVNSSQNVTRSAAPVRGTIANVVGPISSPIVSFPASSCFGKTYAWPSKTSCTY